MRSALLALALLLPAACGGGDDDGVDAPAAGGDLQFCVDETNRYRATVSRPPLARSAALEAYAADGAMIDGTARQAHKHFSDTNGGGLAYAENECPGWGGWTLGGGETIESIMRDCFALMWAEGPGTGAAHGHYNNMIGDYATLGCGVFVDGTAVTVTQDYGR